jgi:hypothetical protein
MHSEPSSSSQLVRYELYGIIGDFLLEWTRTKFPRFFLLVCQIHFGRGLFPMVLVRQ